MARKAFTAKNGVTVGPYSHAVESGEFVFLSGQTPVDPTTGKMAEGDITAQTKQCFNNLFCVLEAAGLTFDDVVKVNVFLTSMSYFQDMNSVYAEHFSAPYPARTTVAVVELPLGASKEIEMIAKKEKAR